MKRMRLPLAVTAAAALVLGAPIAAGADDVDDLEGHSVDEIEVIEAEAGDADAEAEVAPEPEPEPEPEPVQEQETQADPDPEVEVTEAEATVEETETEEEESTEFTTLQETSTEDESSDDASEEESREDESEDEDSSEGETVELGEPVDAWTLEHDHDTLTVSFFFENPVGGSDDTFYIYSAAAEYVVDDPDNVVTVNLAPGESGTFSAPIIYRETDGEYILWVSSASRNFSLATTGRYTSASDEDWDSTVYVQPSPPFRVGDTFLGEYVGETNLVVLMPGQPGIEFSWDGGEGVTDEFGDIYIDIPEGGLTVTANIINTDGSEEQYEFSEGIVTEWFFEHLVLGDDDDSDSEDDGDTDSGNGDDDTTRPDEDEDDSDDSDDSGSEDEDGTDDDQLTVVTPEAPERDGNTVTIPDVEGVDYGYESGSEVEVPEDGLEVNATPEDGYEFPSDATARWEYDYISSGNDDDSDDSDDSDDADDADDADDSGSEDEDGTDDDQLTTVTPEAPERDGNTVTIPDVEGVDYGHESGDEVDIPEDGLAVEATPEDGYEFPEDATTEWKYEYVSEDDDTGAEDDASSSDSETPGGSDTPSAGADEIESPEDGDETALGDSDADGASGSDSEATIEGAADSDHYSELARTGSNPLWIALSSILLAALGALSVGIARLRRYETTS